VFLQPFPLHGLGHRQTHTFTLMANPPNLHVFGLSGGNWSNQRSWHGEHMQTCSASPRTGDLLAVSTN